MKNIYLGVYFPPLIDGNLPAILSNPRSLIFSLKQNPTLITKSASQDFLGFRECLCG